MAAKDFYRPPISTRAQTRPICWPLRSGSRKVKKPYIWKGRRPRIKWKQQPNNWWRGKCMQRSSTQSSAISDKTVCVRPWSTYTKDLRGRQRYMETSRRKNKAEIATQSGEGARPQSRKIDLHCCYLTKEVKLWRFQELDSHTRLRHRTKLAFLRRGKRIFDWKVTPFLNKTKTVDKNFKIIFCDNADNNKTFEENCAISFEEINFDFTSPGTSQQNDVI